ncbi:MAG TPA: pyruvate dehydrogenase (acetyl-transferring), homodimeric type, partial [Acidimicrobiales bacterium]|nr:pyruvate dehydrogenase (acetyl-transferring), homodimeric type [Acidimicrobiales bacterium]
NLIFVVNCNLQRLDGPVRGNGKIIQELEAIFRGAGWSVIKVIWGGRWDELLARDTEGALVNKMNSTTDGEFQKYAIESGEFIRENFFGPDPRLRKIVEHLSDEELRSLPRGGHDHRKLFAAYSAAVETDGAPTVILAKTIKGWKLGSEVQARNSTHQIKKMTKEQLIELRDRLSLKDEIPDSLLDGDDPPYLRPAEGSDVYEYLIAKRKALGGSVPTRSVNYKTPGLPKHSAFEEFMTGSGTQSVSTTMVLARLLRNLIRDETIGTRVVPIVPDEARTFGMDALFREAMIYNSRGQHYTPVDAGLLLSYVESEKGQILEEGISEAGAMASFTAAGTAYANLSTPCYPFFVFYSMFGFQRIGDLIWAAADAGVRGFVVGATAGRTTLAGEGLQHTDGHSHVLASVVPTARAYDPAFAYELAMIIEHGISRMYGDDSEDCFYYLTIYNENYQMPPIPDSDGMAADLKAFQSDLAAAIIKGLYCFATPLAIPKAGGAGGGSAVHVTILFSGSSWSAAMKAREMLAVDWSVSAECWSATSYKSLRDEALASERWNRLHPGSTARVPYVTKALSHSQGPVVAVTDYMKIVPDQISRWVPNPSFTPLGTDGFGRSDTREALRRHFEIDAEHIVVAALASLAERGEIKLETVAAAIARYGIDAEAIDPRLA